MPAKLVLSLIMAAPTGVLVPSHTSSHGQCLGRTGLLLGPAGTGTEGSRSPQCFGAAPTPLLWGLQQHQDPTQPWGLGGEAAPRAKTVTQDLKNEYISLNWLLWGLVCSIAAASLSQLSLSCQELPQKYSTPRHLTCINIFNKSWGSFRGCYLIIYMHLRAAEKKTNSPAHKWSFSQ